MTFQSFLSNINRTRLISLSGYNYIEYVLVIFELGNLNLFVVIEWNDIFLNMPLMYSCI